MKTFKLSAPCPGCKSRYGILLVDTSDPNAEELPIITRCAHCRRVLARTGGPTTEGNE